MSILTGRYPHAHRVQWNGNPLPDEELTIAEILNEKGYKSVAIGKMHFASPAITHGFEYFEIGHHDNPVGEYKKYLEQNKISWWTNKRPAYMTANDDYYKHLYSSASKIPEKYFYMTFTADTAIKKLEELKGKEPFVMWIGFNGPHEPYSPPEPWASKYKPEDMKLPKWIKNEFHNKPKPQEAFFKRQYVEGKPYTLENRSAKDFQIMIARYYGFISLIDKNIGRILDKVEDLGIKDNTIVVFTSDHGDYLGDHHMAFKFISGYDSLYRVPLIIRFPKKIKGGKVFDSLISHVDHLPTLLDLVEIDEPQIKSTSILSYRQRSIPKYRLIQGISFAPLLLEQKYEERKAIFFEMGRAESNYNKIKGVRTKEWKYVFWLHDLEEIYDVKNDPDELYNLADDKRLESGLSRGRAAILRWLVSTEGYNKN